MKILTSSIGSAKDNANSPVHNWYKFAAGFSYHFVEEIIRVEKYSRNSEPIIFDPFAGCGTTLVSSQKKGVTAIGNEGQEFMYDIIRAKLNWEIAEDGVEYYLNFIKTYIQDRSFSFNIETDAHSLLKGLYDPLELQDLCLIRNSLSGISISRYALFFKLALSQALHRVARYPIAVPYISRNTLLKHNRKAIDEFERISRQMLQSIETLREAKLTSKVYKHDSRLENRQINKGDCSVCVTSPPYLNNLDYGEVSKVHTHFFNYTSNWNDITQFVRKKLVTGSTTHYTPSDFDIDSYKKSEFYLSDKVGGQRLIKLSEEIELAKKIRRGKKSFDVLALLYFEDMYLVLKEIRRVIRNGGKAYLILGDSAPYGVLVPTTRILGQMAKTVGFNNYRKYKIRSRGTKWKSLKFRHSLDLDENVLVLQ